MIITFFSKYNASFDNTMSFCHFLPTQVSPEWATPFNAHIGPSDEPPGWGHSVSQVEHLHALRDVDKPLPAPDATTRREYAGMVSHMDAAIGRVVAAMRQQGLWSRTVTFAFSDNGGALNSGASNWPYRGGSVEAHQHVSFVCTSR